MSNLFLGYRFELIVWHFGYLQIPISSVGRPGETVGWVVGGRRAGLFGLPFLFGWLASHDQCGVFSSTAGRIFARGPCRANRVGLPLLPHDGRNGRLRRDSGDLYLYELPYGDRHR